MRTFAFLLACSALSALPQSPQVVTGQLKCTLQSPELLEMVTSDRAIIEWSNFSIENGETVRFIQPNPFSSVLNRVMDAYPSRLMGNLQANGQVLLINPNGILVGKEAEIDTGSFIASTFDLQSTFGEDFVFSGDSLAPVENFGAIHASDGDVCLIGARVENHGSIDVQGGLAGLFAAEEVLLKPSGEERIFIRAKVWNDEENFFAQAFVPDDQGAQFGYAVQKGSISCQNSDETGGWVGVFGGIVEMDSDSCIDVSAPNGGGTVLIGGDFKGSNPHLENARFTWVGPSTKILANATNKGNGGKVIVWSDESTSFYGQIEAMGGRESGDGGLVEVSGNYLDFQGMANTLAYSGKIGNLFLDPLDITVTTAANMNVAVAIGPPRVYTPVAPVFPAPTVCIAYGTPPVPGSSILNRATLVAALGLNNVTVQTTGTVGACDGDILFTTAGGTGWAAPTTLTLDAAHDIVILANILNTGGVGVAGNIILQAGHQIRINDHTLIPAAFSLFCSVGSQNGNTTVNAPLADLILQGGNNNTSLYSQLGFPLPTPGVATASGPINITCANVLLEAGAMNGNPAFIGHGNPVTFLGQSGDASGAITITTTGDIILRNQVGAVTGNSCYNRIGHGGTDVAGPNNLTGNITINCGGRLRLEFADNPVPNNCVAVASCVNFFSAIGHRTAPTAALTATGNIDITVQGDIFLGYPSSVNAAVSTSNRIGHAATTVNGNLTVRSCGNITMDTSQCTSVGFGTNLIGVDSNPVTVTMNTTVISNGNVTLNSGVAGTPAQTASNTIGQISQILGPATSLYTGDVRVIAGGSVLLSYNTIGTSQLGDPVHIGATNTNVASVSNTFVSARTDITIANFGTGVGAGNAPGMCGILAVNDINVAALNDIFLSANVNNVLATNGFAAIGPTQYDRGSTTRVFAGRDLLCTNNGTVPNRTTLAQSYLAPAAVANISLSARAAGDLQVASDIFTAFGTTGNILIEADSAFAAGGLISTVGGDVTTIAGRALGAPAVTLPGCMAALNSVAIAADGLGAARFNKGAVAAPASALTINTTTGDISVHSARLRRDGVTLQNLTISNAANNTNLNLTTTDGDLDVSGTICTDAFNSITLTGATTTTGNICLRSVGALAINFPVTATGAGSSLSIITTTGDLTLAANVSTVGGPLRLSAGYPLTANCCPVGDCCCDALHCCCTPAVCGTAGNGAFSINQTAGAITTTDSGGNIGTISLSAAEDITIAGAATSVSSQTGAIQMCGNDTVNVNRIVSSTSGPIIIAADGDDSGTGNLNITADITTTGNFIFLTAGFGAGAGGTSAINQTGGLISSGGGAVTALAISDITFSGASPTTINTGGGLFTANSLEGSIAVDEDILTGGGNADFTAGLDINVNSGGSVSSGAGQLTMNANNDITINGDATSLTTTSGDIFVIADFDNSGFGDLTVRQNITSTAGGDICLAAGPGTFGCSDQNCSSGLIAGFPFGFCTVSILGGTVSSTTGAINVVAAQDIVVNGASPSIQTAGPIALTAGLGDLAVDQQIRSTGGPITTFAGNNTALTQGAGPTLIHAAGEIRMITGLNMFINANTAILSNLPGDQVTIVVDNLHPNQPVFPSAQSGSLTMRAGSSITSGSPLRIFTAYSQAFLAGPGVNSIDPTVLLNGMNPFAFGYPTTPGNNTPYEQYCVFFGCPNNYPFSNLGDPFTFFYKVCIQLLAQQANLIVSEQLEEFSNGFYTDWGVDEYWGWPTKFYLLYNLDPQIRSLAAYRDHPPEPYFQTKKQFRLVHPYDPHFKH